MARSTNRQSQRLTEATRQPSPANSGNQSESESSSTRPAPSDAGSSSSSRPTPASSRSRASHNRNFRAYSHREIHDGLLTWTRARGVELELNRALFLRHISTVVLRSLESHPDSVVGLQASEDDRRRGLPMFDPDGRTDATDPIIEADEPGTSGGDQHEPSTPTAGTPATTGENNNAPPASGNGDQPEEEGDAGSTPSSRPSRGGGRLRRPGAQQQGTPQTHTPRPLKDTGIDLPIDHNAGTPTQLIPAWFQLINQENLTAPQRGALQEMLEHMLSTDAIVNIRRTVDDVRRHRIRTEAHTNIAGSTINHHAFRVFLGSFTELMVFELEESRAPLRELVLHERAAHTYESLVRELDQYQDSYDRLRNTLPESRRPASNATGAMLARRAFEYLLVHQPQAGSATFRLDDRRAQREISRASALLYRARAIYAIRHYFGAGALLFLIKSNWRTWTREIGPYAMSRALSAIAGRTPGILRLFTTAYDEIYQFIAQVEVRAIPNTLTLSVGEFSGPTGIERLRNLNNSRNYDLRTLISPVRAPVDFASTYGQGLTYGTAADGMVAQPTTGENLGTFGDDAFSDDGIEDEILEDQDLPHDNNLLWMPREQRDDAALNEVTNWAADHVSDPALHLDRERDVSGGNSGDNTPMHGVEVGTLQSQEVPHPGDVNMDTAE